MQTIKIIRVEVLGYCMGVSRAVNIVEKLLERRGAGGSENPIYTTGDLIHNENVMNELLKKNVLPLENDTKIKGADIVIRAHGIPFLAQKEMENNGANLHDATCPKVKQNQLLAKKLCDDGFIVFLAGKAEHAEIKGILGYAPRCICIQDEKDAENKSNAIMTSNNKIALIPQTTYSIAQFEAIKKILKNKFGDIVVKNTICPATEQRQKALASLAKKCDIIVVVGSASSANTLNLVKIAESMGKIAVLAENACNIAEKLCFLREKPFLDKETVTIGLASGASTPLSQIEEIEKEVKKLCN